MTNDRVTFGLVIAPTPPRGLPEEDKVDPTRALKATMAASEEHIEAVRGHFDIVWAEDHFQWEKRPVVEAMTTLSYLVGRHEGFRFGHLVLGQSYRSPSLTAKMAANLQMLTGGNFILGIGAGWKEDEYIAYGFPYPPASVRIEQLDEAAQIIKELWTKSPANFQGKHYHIVNAECQPQPNPPIPLMIGGGGNKTLRVVARYADWWNYNFCNAEEYADRQRVLAEHCREVGRDPGEIVHTYYGIMSLVDDPSKVEKRDFHLIGGTPDMVTRELEEFMKLGVTHFQFRFADFPSFDGLNGFIEKVLPRLTGSS